jgi:hypothetical protein
LVDLSETEPLIAPAVFPPHGPAQPQAHLHRTPNVARVHDESLRGRVEKLRKVSSVVIDEAAYDPSLRFILVAAVLFLLFLFLLILSKLLG